jgi:hypothetical protein
MKRIFAIPKTPFSRPFSSCSAYPNSSPYGSTHCPCVNTNSAYSPRNINMPYSTMHPPFMQQPVMRQPVMQQPVMRQPVMPSGYKPVMIPMAYPSNYPYSVRQYPAYGGRSKKQSHTRRQRKKSQKGGGSLNNDCYQNNQRYVYDSQGQMGLMQPNMQGGQRFVFPYAVETVMAPTDYPAIGPVTF